MYNVNDVIVYGRTGICTVEKIEKKKFSVKSSTEHLCYVLKPYYDASSTVFVPVDNEKLTANIRDIFTKKEIDAMLEKAKGEKEIWIEEQRARTDNFRKTLSKGICYELVAMIMCLYNQKKQLVEIGKKLCSSDEGILKDAKNEINREFSYALNISQDEVEDYILARI